MVVIMVLLYVQNQKLSKEVDRLGSNQDAILSGVKYSHDSTMAEVKKMTMTVGEVKQYLPDLTSELKG